KSELATLEERRRSAESVLQRIGHLASEMEARVDSLISQIESAATEKGQRETENLEIAEKLVNLDAERNACELRASLLQSDSEQVAQTCLNELGVQRAELMGDTNLPRVLDDELVTEEQACQEMRSRLDSMGPVNMMALEEYRETAERQTFLDTQRKDLL